MHSEYKTGQRTMDKKTIIIADNQDITRLGLKTLVRAALKEVDGLEVKELSRRAELIAELKDNPSAVVIIDYTLFDLGSTDELLNLSDRFPYALWVLFSDELTEGLIRRLSVEQQFSMILKDDSDYHGTEMRHHWCALPLPSGHQPAAYAFAPAVDSGTRPTDCYGEGGVATYCLGQVGEGDCSGT